MMHASPAQAELDSHLFDALTVIEAKDVHPRESRAYVRIDHCHRQYWHTLFDICPGALTLSPPDGLALFRPFMAWAAKNGVGFDWSYYLVVCEWLAQSEFRDRLSEDLLVEMTGASAARWAVLDRSADCGIVIGRAGSSMLVIGWKQRTVDGGREIELVELEEPLPDPEGTFGYFTVRSHELDAFPGWKAIPR